MPTVCCVPDCYVSTSDKGSHMFRFPKNPKLRNEWLSRIPGNEGKNKIEVIDTTRICSNHFHPALIRRRIDTIQSTSGK